MVLWMMIIMTVTVTAIFEFYLFVSAAQAGSYFRLHFTSCTRGAASGRIIRMIIMISIMMMMMILIMMMRMIRIMMMSILVMIEVTITYSFFSVPVPRTPG